MRKMRRKRALADAITVPRPARRNASLMMIRSVLALRRLTF
jgi:hypothetical protein